MSDLEARLDRCFALVFPDLPDDQIRAASVDDLAAWDSLAGVTLLAVLEEEFAAPIDPILLPDLTSYTAVLAHLKAIAG